MEKILLKKRSSNGSIKMKSFYIGERFLYSWVFLRFTNALGWPSLKRTHCYRNLPYNTHTTGFGKSNNQF
jgi:hypothetical protein